MGDSPDSTTAVSGDAVSRAPPVAAAPAPGAPPGPNLQMILKDVVAMIDPDTRRRFRSFVQRLKLQRDSGQIPSLSNALLEQGPAVVGRDVWARCLANQGRGLQPPAPPAPDAAALHEERQRKAVLEAQREQQQRELQRRQVQAEIDGPQAAPRETAAAGEQELLRDGDLVEAPALVEAPQAPARRTSTRRNPPSVVIRWADQNVADEPICRRRLELASAKVGARLGVPLRAPTEGSLATCELISRATQTYLRAAVEGMMVLSRRRRNEEARRVASRDSCALKLRWRDSDARALTEAEARRCAKRDALLDAMLDHDILTSPPLPDDEAPRSLWATAKRARAAELGESGTDLSRVSDVVEFSTKKVKREDEAADRAARFEPRIEAEPDVITLEDVNAWIRSQRGTRAGHLFQHLLWCPEAEEEEEEG